MSPRNNTKSRGSLYALVAAGVLLAAFKSFDTWSTAAVIVIVAAAASLATAVLLIAMEWHEGNARASTREKRRAAGIVVTAISIVLAGSVYRAGPYGTVATVIYAAAAVGGALGVALLLTSLVSRR